MPPKESVRALPAAPPLLSLLASAEDLTESNSRWESGVSYEPETCGNTNVGAVDPCDVSDIEPELGSGSVDVEPFYVWAADSCSSFGFGARDWQGRAQRKLLACQSHQIEAELWRGNIARSSGWPNSFFASSAAISVTSVGVTPLAALACLEQSLGDCNCGGRGMIHATRQVVTHWVEGGLIEREGNKLVTKLGTIVVPGSGYDGSGPPSVANDPPIAPADGSIWAYATSMVHFRLGSIQPLPATQSEAMDRLTNTITYRAQRLVEVGFDCCLFAAEIDLPVCDVG